MKQFNLVVPVGNARRRIYIIGTGFLLFLLITLSTWRSGSSLADPLMKIATKGWREPHPNASYKEKEDDWTPPKNYDPVNHNWEAFSAVAESYNGSIHNLGNLKESPYTRGKPGVVSSENASRAKIYDPYPDYQSTRYRNAYRGSHISCIGARGVRLNESYDDMVWAYDGVPSGFPEPSLGSSLTLDLDHDVCFDRVGRYGAYGHVVNETGYYMSTPSDIDWDQVNWGNLQRECVRLNSDRFGLNSRTDHTGSTHQSKDPSSGASDPTRKQRTAVLLRAYSGLEYTPNMLQNIRAMITELSLNSGGEYEVFLLVEVRESLDPVWSEPNITDPPIYEQTKRRLVPQEFWNMTVLWNAKQWRDLYPLVPERWRAVHFSQWMPVQYFAHRNPEFNFYWNIEVDVRYTGHYYHLSEQLSNWARAQPRKGIWERSNHFYVPRVHGAYSTDFTQWVQKKNSPPGKPWGKHSDRSIWGPVEVLPGGSEFPLADSPPTPNPDEDSYSWGVGEDADLITLLPIFPPHETHYAFLGDYWNYPEVPPAPEPPKRCSIVTTYRFSHRLLDMMHLENSNAPGHHMGSEMWPSSVCLHHGYKAVYAPHPIWLDRKWPAKALDYIFNPGPGADAGGSESVFGLDREHNFLGSTWYYRADWARSLYWRFLGWESQGIGGKEWEQKNGRFCMPPMLLHPIKDAVEPEAES